MGSDVTNHGPQFSYAGSAVVGWELVVGIGGASPVHKSSHPLGPTVAASTAVLADLISGAQTSQAAFESELPTAGSPSVRDWYDGLPSSQQDDLYESIKAFDAP